MYGKALQGDQSDKFDCNVKRHTFEPIQRRRSVTNFMRYIPTDEARRGWLQHSPASGIRRPVPADWNSIGDLLNQLQVLQTQYPWWKFWNN